MKEHQQTVTKPRRHDKALRQQAVRIWKQSGMSAEVTAALRKQGEAMGRKRVARLMKDAGMQGRQARRYRVRTTDRAHNEPIAPNLLSRASIPTKPDEVWATDITYARQMRRSNACIRKLRTDLGRVIREIVRQSPPESLRVLLDTSKRIHAQKRGDKDKAYREHEPEVACIAKGKAGRKYEFGQKVSVATTNKGGWLVGALCVPGNPYDGHTLKAQMEQVECLYSRKGHLKTIHVDMSYGTPSSM